MTKFKTTVEKGKGIKIIRELKQKISERKGELNSIAVSVYRYLCDRASWANFECFPSHATIAKDLKISKSSVKRATEALSRAGLICIEYRFLAEKNGAQSSNLYTLIIDESLFVEAALFAISQRKEWYNNWVQSIANKVTRCLKLIPRIKQLSFA